MSTKYKHAAAASTPGQSDRLFAAGLAAHQQGKLEQAFASYEAALQEDGRHFDALHHVGILGYQSGNYELALEFIGAAIDVNPHVSATYSNLGNIFKAIGERKAALQSYDQALGLDARNVDALYNRGNVLQQLESFDEALASYERALALAPDDIDAWNNCAVVLQQLKRNDEALASCERALALNPGHAEAHNNRANILGLLDRPEEALAGFERALALRPDYADARVNLGNCLHALGRLEEALACLDAALLLAPDSAEAHHGRANVLRKLKRVDEALAGFRQAVVQKPGSAAYRASLGSMLNEQKMHHGALECFDAAIAIDDTVAACHNDRCLALQGLKRYPEALASIDRALALDPDYLDAKLNRSNVLGDLGRFDDAVAAYDAVIKVRDDAAPVWNNRGNALEALARYDDARASFDRAIAIDPAYQIAHWNLALLNLRFGRLEDGWRGYEWRWKNESLNCYAQKRDFVEPLWLGKESLEGTTILLFAEQGLGDTLQFCRYVPLVAALGARIVLEVQRPLVKLLSGLEGVTQVIARDDPLPAFDLQCPLMSLGLAFGTTVATIPAPPSYLPAPTDRIAQWHARLGPHVRPRIGLAWRGNADHANDHNRSMTLAALAPLFELDCQFVSLQKEYRAEDRTLLASGVVLQMEEHLGDFSDTAALCALMDIVIAVDTSVAHLAGALGKPLWVMLPKVTDWRWLTDRCDSPWYPSARLFRQQDTGDWAGVIESVKAAIGAVCRDESAMRSAQTRACS